MRITDDSQKSVVQVRFNASCQTKSVSYTERDKIDILDVFVFSHETGEMITHERTQSLTVEIYLERDMTYDCHFVANAGEQFDDIYSAEQLRSAVSELSDNIDHFVMHGKVSRTFMNDSNVDVELTRLCSKITVDYVTPKFVNKEISEAGVEFARMYLVDVYGEMGILVDLEESDIIYNDNGMDEGLNDELRNLFCKDFYSNVIDSSRLKVDTEFFCYSNDTNGQESSKTRLVLEFNIGGQANFYTVFLPTLRPNHEYRIDDIRLLGFGSDKPGEKLDRTTISLTIKVNPWDSAEDKDAILN